LPVFAQWRCEHRIAPEQAAAIESNTNEIRDLKTMLDAFSVQLAQLNTQIGDLQGAVARRDANY
jgi:hypothetical protein